MLRVNGFSQSSMPFSTWGVGESFKDFISRNSANCHAQSQSHHSTGNSALYGSIESVSSTLSDPDYGMRSQQNVNVSQQCVSGVKPGLGQNFLSTPVSHQAPSERVTEQDVRHIHATSPDVKVKKSNDQCGVGAFIRCLLPCVNAKKSDS